MKIAFFDCPSGISGDMTLGALADCGVDLAAMQAGIDSLGYPGVKLVAEEVHRKGFLGLKVHVMGEGCRYDLTGRHAYPPDEHAAFCALPNAGSGTH